MKRRDFLHSVSLGALPFVSSSGSANIVDLAAQVNSCESFLDFLFRNYAVSASESRTEGYGFGGGPLVEEGKLWRHMAFLVAAKIPYGGHVFVSRWPSYEQLDNGVQSVRFSFSA